jgi:integrase
MLPFGARQVGQIKISKWAKLEYRTQVGRGDRVLGEKMTEKVVWQLLQPYATAAGVPGIAPHDLRRSCAKMCRAAGGELEQIQLLLGHASVQTTERYLGTKQDLVHAPNDGIKLRVAV